MVAVAFPVDKSFSTMGTSVALDLGMIDLDVLAESAGVDEEHPTVVTQVRPLPRVKPAVTRQVCVPGEAPAADVTDALLGQVPADMALDLVLHVA